MSIGEAVRLRITELCHGQGITLNKLSTICGITQSTLNNIVSGRNATTTVSTVKKICDGLEISILEFFSSPLFQDLEQEIK
ncbi:MAG: helix-turn-helix transcriptional regulator [Clostridia bacterium]|nr:helix-turn-helix transcriptional regulator [Clostridia bacterium]